MNDIKVGVTVKHKTTPIVKEFEPMKETKVTVNLPVIMACLFIIILGVISGYILSRNKSGKAGGIVTSGKTNTGLAKIVGQNENKFKDKPAEGILRTGGIDGEGTHHLERPGGDSQNVYLTSSSVPLDDYLDKKIKVWGDTFSAEKAGWLMDVGRLELLE